MIILGEPIGTWISIAAIFISLSTLFLTSRKQRYEERTALARQITDLKTSLGENRRIAKYLLNELEELEGMLSS